MASEERIAEFVFAVQKLWWDVVGLSETKIEGEALINKINETVITYIILVVLRDTP